MPLMNIINGGAHADNALDIQEFMIVPAGFDPVSYTHLRAHETVLDLVCRLLLETKNTHESLISSGSPILDAMWSAHPQHS